MVNVKIGNRMSLLVQIEIKHHSVRDTERHEKNAIWQMGSMIRMKGT